jgi:4-carboxymuconolactone decarboxylase
MRWVLATILITLIEALPHQAIAADQQRFPVVRYDELTPEQKEWADKIAAPPRNAKFANPPYNTYLRNPPLAARATAMSDYLRWNTSLPARLSEFTILVGARHWYQQYEWHQHYPLALKAGLDKSVLDDMIEGKRPSKMMEDEAIIYDLASQLYRDKNVSDEVFKAAVNKFNERGVLDIVGILGYYDFVAMTLIMSKVEPPVDDIPRLKPLAKE